jgi:hypothetical protein
MCSSMFLCPHPCFRVLIHASVFSSMFPHPCPCCHVLIHVPMSCPCFRVLVHDFMSSSMFPYLRLCSCPNSKKF